MKDLDWDLDLLLSGSSLLHNQDLDLDLQVPLLPVEFESLESEG